MAYKSWLKDLAGLAMQAQLELQIMDNILSWCIIFTLIPVKPTELY